VIVAVAHGGGLGHLSRIRAAVATLGLGDDVMVITASPFGADLRVLGGLGVVGVPADVGARPEPLRAWTRETLGTLSPSVLLLDAFPFGLLGEFDGSVVQAGCRVVHLARRLRWRRYCEDVGVPASPVRFDTTYVLEPLEAEHAEFLSTVSREVRGLELADPADAPDAAAVERLRALRSGGRPVWLVAHAGPPDEVEELVGYAREHAASLGRDPAFAVAAPAGPVADDIVAVDAIPLHPLFPFADVVVTACGFNAMRQLIGLRAEGRHVFLPLPRRFDDQFARAAQARSVSQLAAGE
jgi:hypothetical protein